MTTQPEALQMAKDFDSYAGTLPDRCYFEAATELRRLHAVNQEMLDALKGLAVCDFGANWNDAAEMAAIKARAAIAKATGETK